MKKTIYKKNEDYTQDEIIKLISIYQLASEAGDNKTVQDAFDKIYSFIEKYVYNVLWKNYGTIMKNPQFRDDLMQEVWLKIFTEIKNYNPEKGAITTFIAPWIKHVVAEYSSKNFRNTSVYYANAIKKVNGAQNYCKQNGIIPDMDNICKLSGMSETTVKNALELLEKKDHISYESLLYSGVEHVSPIKGPEESAIEMEASENLTEIINEVLNEEERQVLSLLLSPSDPGKDHASYREIMERIPGSNIPRIKRIVSRITSKLKANQKFNAYFGYILEPEETFNDNKIPVLDADEDDGNTDFDDLWNDGI